MFFRIDRIEITAGCPDRPGQLGSYGARRCTFDFADDGFHLSQIVRKQRHNVRVHAADRERQDFVPYFSKRRADRGTDDAAELL